MPTNPDSGAAELMSPGSIGAALQSINTVPSDYHGTTMVDWYAYLRNKGLGKPVHVLEIPGYEPPPIVMVGQYMSIESALQQTVKWLVGPVLTRTWSDARVNSFLSGVAVDYAIWNGTADPGGSNLQGLVDNYTKVYRVAVTPV